MENTLELRPAKRQKAKIRLGLAAVSGGGKTYSALLIAYGICGDWSKIVVIDSENNSADMYEHIGPFMVIPFPPPYSPERYIQAIEMCEKAGIEVAIIDSMSHEWEGEGGILNMADAMGGGFQGAWKTLTPRHDKFKNAILGSSCHMITTVRRKQEYIMVEEQNKQGRMVQKPVKAGMKEITREGWEYELTINLELDANHLAKASKDRTGLFTDKEPFVISVKTGELIRQWCESGVDIQNEINVACNNLSSCDNIESLKALKEGLPEYVVTSDQFKKAGATRFQEITKAITESPKTPLAQPPAATLPENTGKLVITDKQFVEVCKRISNGDLAVYTNAMNVYQLLPKQEEYIKNLFDHVSKVEAALAVKQDAPEKIIQIIGACTNSSQITRLHQNNALIIDREPGVKHVLEAKLVELGKAA